MEVFREGSEKDSTKFFLFINKEVVLGDCRPETNYLDKSLQLLCYKEAVLDGTDEENETMSNAREVVDMYMGAIMGDHIYQAVIGALFYEGKRVEIDYKEAFYWCMKAAEYGIGMDEQQYYVGRMYERGQGVKKDSKKAIEWYLKAVTDNNIFAIIRLSELLINE